MQTAALIALCLAASADPAPEPDAEVRKLQLKVVEVLKEGVRGREAEYKAGRATSDSLLEVAKALRDAQLDLTAKPAERVAAHQAYLKVVADADQLSAARYSSGRCSLTDHCLMRAERLRAEIELRKAGGKPPRGIKPPADVKAPEKEKDDE
jgi:hypothetical protein